ncbi:amidohydrolase [Hylemonella gracilis]|uniref:Amidohydrolase n=1 Tax=Hylemonella gracilis TaxID=80880 RepID=A0A4P6UNI2_9BURK|nr:amidohydrolase family protein [Hylemonella gracilis]QBK06336.1 amidohydrolase [Hylemonella gracilis]
MSAHSPEPQPVLTYLRQPSKPALQLPAGACDAHVHVFGPASDYPYAPQRHMTPVDAPRETLFALHRHLGIERCVIVQSMVHGQDNRVVEDAIAAGQGRYLGVALVDVGVADAELRRLAAAGFRGVRFNFMQRLGAASPVEPIIALTRRLAEVGMHLQVHFESALIHMLAQPLARSAVPVVIDHMGRVDATLGAGHADFQALLRLMENPLFRVKVSGIDRIDALAPSDRRYAAGEALARELVARFPERCLWGTDWPHPNHTHVPDDGALVDALARVMPDRTHLEQVLVHNPLHFYGFSA